MHGDCTVLVLLPRVNECCVNQVSFTNINEIMTGREEESGGGGAIWFKREARWLAVHLTRHCKGYGITQRPLDCRMS